MVQRRDLEVRDAPHWPLAPEAVHFWGGRGEEVVQE